MACTEVRREQLADLAQGRASAEVAGDLLLHVEQCASCSAEFDLLADVLTAAPPKAASVEPAHAPRPLSRRAPVWLAAAVVVAAAVWWLAGGGDAAPARRLSELAQIDPVTAPDTVLRGDGRERPADYARGIAAYRDGDYAGAVRALSTVVDADPEDALAALYLGVALLQTGAPASALLPLQIAAEHGTGLVRERALWYAAAASLQREDAAAARRALERLRALDGDFAPNADELLRALEGR